MVRIAFQFGCRISKIIWPLLFQSILTLGNNNGWYFAHLLRYFSLSSKNLSINANNDKIQWRYLWRLVKHIIFPWHDFSSESKLSDVRLSINDWVAAARPGNIDSLSSASSNDFGPPSWAKAFRTYKANENNVSARETMPRKIQILSNLVLSAICVPARDEPHRTKCREAFGGKATDALGTRLVFEHITSDVKSMDSFFLAP